MKRLAINVILVIASGLVVPSNATGQEVVGAPIVLACIDKSGKLLSAEIFQSSNYPDLDAAALKVAQATKFSPGTNAAKKPLKRSCLKFKVKFVVRDGKPVPAEG
ncbi:MAG TPA: energy transducer TonB [Steroidobacteraceae bacterium]|nr:energy transducer TonB [Steroidobacteraceae bacterium]